MLNFIRKYVEMIILFMISNKLQLAGVFRQVQTCTGISNKFELAQDIARHLKLCPNMYIVLKQELITVILPFNKN